MRWSTSQTKVNTILEKLHFIEQREKETITFKSQQSSQILKFHKNKVRRVEVVLRSLKRR